MTTTITQANNLMTLGKFILGGLGFLICVVFYSTMYGTSFMLNTKHSIDTLSINVKQSSKDFREFKADTKSDIKELKDGQAAMQSNVQFLMDNMRNMRQKSFVTEKRNPITGVTTIVR